MAASNYRGRGTNEPWRRAKWLGHTGRLILGFKAAAKFKTRESVRDSYEERPYETVRGGE